MSCPRSILGSSGSRIKILLGDTGSDYIFISNNDDGDTKWQNQYWFDSGGFPDKIFRQIINCCNKGRNIMSIASGPQGEWYIYGKKGDGTGGYAWWGGLTTDFGAYVTGCNQDNIKVSIGDEGRYVVIHGTNGFATSNYIHPGLLNRIGYIRNRSKVINFIRLLPNDAYFISDSEGTKWGGISNQYLAKELKRGCHSEITDVLVAADGSWIVLRHGSYVTSTGISDELKNHIQNFYRDQKRRRDNRVSAIATFYKEQERQQKEQEERERLRLEKERLRIAKEKKQELARKRKAVEDRNFEIAAKRIEVGDHVTALGLSQNPGDATVQSIGNEGTITLRCKGKVMKVLPNKVILPNNVLEDTPKDFHLLCMAQDKYEAAIALYHCTCDETKCTCTKLASGTIFLNSGSRRLPTKITHGMRVYVKGQAFATIIKIGVDNNLINVKYDDGRTDHTDAGKLQLEYITACPVPHRSSNDVRPFDLYKCEEKISIDRLRSIKMDLEKDSDEIKALLRQSSNLHPLNIKKMQRYIELEAVVNALYEYVEEHIVPDDSGFVQYEVDYEHKDSSGRGRLFAKGLVVEIQTRDYPRSATLQGMHSDLRAPLIGSVAHDIDSVNSEVALLCSLAMQMNLKELVPTLFDYRDNRQKWIEIISSLHNVPESGAKRLSTIVINGGNYETWKRVCDISQNNMKMEQEKVVKKFVLNLKSEVKALLDKVLLHPRFRWTLVERNNLREKISGKNLENKLDMALLPRIIQSCENDVLSLIHRCFFDHQWIVRAKIFDGLIVEKGLAVTSSLETVMRAAEASCLSQGWQIELLEKPLYGKQNDPIETIVEAREVMQSHALY